MRPRKIIRTAPGNLIGSLKTLPIVIAAAFLWLEPARLPAEEPMEQVRQTVDRILAIVNDPRLRDESRRQERRRKLREAIVERFDFPEMARRSLGPDWRRLRPEQQKEFINLFSALLEDAYLDRIESYSGQKVEYIRERRDGDYAEVETRIVDRLGREFPVDYRLRRTNGDWKVYDVVIENVSLVANYRSQFRRVLARSSVEDLLARMKDKAFSAA
ncbi:MAG TPA: ABC transporter substrate-binding protein [Thermoanaerobaculia bacterium]|jgi:phospholipid transport system substrate-binding protein